MFDDCNYKSAYEVLASPYTRSSSKAIATKFGSKTLKLECEQKFGIDTERAVDPVFPDHIEKKKS